MKLRIYTALIFFIFSLNLNVTYAGGIEEDDETSSEGLELIDNELSATEDNEDYQELTEATSNDEVNVCDENSNVIKWSKGCVTWSGGYVDEDEIPDIYVRYGS